MLTLKLAKTARKACVAQSVEVSRGAARAVGDMNMKCPNCGNEKTVEVKLVGHDNVVVCAINEKGKARLFTHASLHSELCTQCGNVFNLHIEKDEINKFI